MSEPREWTTVDKSEWGPGPWTDEPDKVQWVDEETGLDCLLHRGPGGQWCGYVGVPEGHPYHGVGYSDCPMRAGCPDRGEDSYWCDHTPETVVDVHGGLTYSDFCREPLDGDHSHGICHIPEPGRPARVWWLGFDCAHLGDLCPKYDRDGLVDSLGTYKARYYVERECRSLAKQLVNLAAPSPTGEAPNDG